MYSGAWILWSLSNQSGKFSVSDIYLGASRVHHGLCCVFRDLPAQTLGNVVQVQKDAEELVCLSKMKGWTGMQAAKLPDSHEGQADIPPACMRCRLKRRSRLVTG